MAVLRHRDRIEGDLVIEVAFTGADLDIGDGASPAEREGALAAVARESGATPVLMSQVHGAQVAVVDTDPDAQSPPPVADALVTTRTDVALLARAADCVPVLLGDPDTGAVAAVHAGRQGVVDDVVGAAVGALRGAGAHRVVAWIGPHVCGSCYEVPDELARVVAAVVPETRTTTSWGTSGLDLGAGVRAQLEAAGVTEVRDVGVCTLEDRAWPSYRRDGSAATRFAGLVWSHP